MGIYEEALAEADLKKKLKLFKKAIKEDPRNLDKRLLYISLIDNPKKKMDEYDILVGDEYRSLNKTYADFEDLKRILTVCISYINDAFSLGFIDEGIECGLSCLKIDEFDNLNIRRLLVNNIFKKNRLNDYFNTYLSFNTSYDLFSHLIFFSVIGNIEEFNKIYNRIKETIPDLICLINDESSNNKEANEIFKEYNEAYLIAKDKIRLYIKEA